MPPRVPLKPPSTSGPAPTNYSAGGWRQEEMVPKVTSRQYEPHTFILPYQPTHLYFHTIYHICLDQGIPTSRAAQQIQEPGALSQANPEAIQHKSCHHSITISLTITEANLEATFL